MTTTGGPKYLGASHHTMLGPGGRIVEPESESKQIDRIIFHVSEGRVDTAIRMLERLREQVSQGYHRNPAGLVVYGNPPVRLGRRTLKGPGVIGLIGTEVDAIYYRNADGKKYVHDFEDAKHVLMFAVERGGQRDITITNEDGKPLWEEM